MYVVAAATAIREGVKSLSGRGRTRRDLRELGLFGFYNVLEDKGLRPGRWIRVQLGGAPGVATYTRVVGRHRLQRLLPGLGLPAPLVE